MPRLTRKYSSAIDLLQSLQLPLSGNQEEIYDRLNQQSYYWDSALKNWIKNDISPDSPTELIRVRVWADSRFVEVVAQDCIQSLASKGFRCVDKSEAFPCRPPKQLESRIYLSFQKESNGSVLLSGSVVLGSKKSS